MPAPALGIPGGRFPAISSQWKPVITSYSIHYTKLYELTQQPPVLLLPNLWLGGELKSVLEIKKKNSLRVYMDCQDTSCTSKTQGLIEGLQSVDVFAPNAREAMCITGETTPKKALDKLSLYRITSYNVCYTKLLRGRRKLAALS